MAEIDEALDQIRKSKDSLASLLQEISSFFVFDQDLDRTEENLKALRAKVSLHADGAKRVVEANRKSYPQAVEVSQELTNLELIKESVQNAMEDKEREFKKARTIRTDYASDVLDLQSWIKEAELRIQDRSIEPQMLHDNLQEVQSEIASASDKLERLVKNGETIVENSRDEEEKSIVKRTMDDLRDQLQQVKSWLEEKKQQVGETLDAWQRFLSLYQAVMAWVDERKVFLKEPLHLSTLHEARQKLHDYSVSTTKRTRRRLVHWGWLCFRTPPKVAR